MRIIGSLALLGLAALGYKYRAEIKSEVQDLKGLLTDNMNSRESVNQPMFDNATKRPNKLQKSA